MSLYAIGDLHLHFGSELKIGHPQLKDRAWKNHEEKFRKNCAKLLTAGDTLVLVGDHSWGKTTDACEPDLQYIIDLPGRKILTRGNHDMFWDAKKTDALNERYKDRLFFLQKLLKQKMNLFLKLSVLLTLGSESFIFLIQKVNSFFLIIMLTAIMKMSTFQIMGRFHACERQCGTNCLSFLMIIMKTTAQFLKTIR